MREEAACVANIGPLGRRRRLRSGFRSLVLGGGVGAALVLAGVPRRLRLGVFPLFVLGAIGIFQAYEQTCVVLAAQATRDLDSGEERIEDQAVVRQVRRQALKVFVESGLSAALLTAAVVALPRRRANTLRPS
jgi:hypothetical protein